MPTQLYPIAFIYKINYNRTIFPLYPFLSFSFPFSLFFFFSNTFLITSLSQGIDGARVEKVLEHCGVTVNKNSVPGDTRPFVPGGLRIGTPALTTRGLKEKDFDRVVEFIDRGIKIAIELNKQHPEAAKSLKKFNAVCAQGNPAIEQLKNEVEAFALSFPMP